MKVLFSDLEKYEKCDYFSAPFYEKMRLEFLVPNQILKIYKLFKKAWP